MSTWCLDPTIFIHGLDDLTSRHKSVSQARGDFKSEVNGHEIIEDSIPTPCFEYIVVGGGTAGLALASRLAESLAPGQFVCVIEAGVYREDAVVDVPGAYGMALGDKDYDWSYQTVPQPNLNGRQVASSAGRLLGGSSGINFLARIRASSPEYDAWNEFGRGWDWNGLLPYFKAQEHYEPYEWATDQIYPGITEEEDKAARQEERVFRGHGGPVHSTHNTLYTDLLKPTVETLRSFGIKTNRSPGCGDSTGILNAETAVNREQGTRSYAANAYLRNPKSIVSQQNLIVLKGVCATKILFDSRDCTRDVKAVGLACLGGIDWKFPVAETFPFELRVNKEIIVSAGTYNTPRLLEFSGVGNPAILSQFNIPTVVDLPAVGENLQDHFFVASDFTVKEGVFTIDRLRNDPEYRAEQVKEYRDKKTGAYATAISVYSFFKLKNFLTKEEVDELKAELEKEISVTSNPFHKRQLEIQREYLEHDGVGDVEVIMVPRFFVSVPKQNASYITLVASLAHPVSRGSTHISSPNPLDPPTINPRYLNNPFDTKLLTKVTQFMRKISETAPLKDVIVAPSTPGPEVRTYADFESFARNCLTSVHHPLGTAAMAPRSLGGVVDNELRVYGTENVRVADMSIAPLQIAAHLVDTAYAIGEKAADLIKATKKTE